MNSILAYFNKPILKLSLLFGLALGILVFVFFLGLYAMDIVPLGNNKVLDIGIHVILIAGACWYYRKKAGNGFLHLWEALTIGYVVNTVGALIAGWLIYFFVTYIDPSVFTAYITQMKDLMLQGKAELVKNIGEAEFQKMYQGVGEMATSEIIMDEVGKKTVMAIIPILVISLILRKQDYSILQNNKS